MARDPSLSPVEKAILLVLAGHAWGDCAVCWPSATTIGKAVGRSPDHVRRVIRGLDSRGVISRERADNATGRIIRLPWKMRPVDRLEVLRSLPYLEYLETPEWIEKRTAAYARAGGRCVICNSNQELNAHHRTYERIGEELPEDLIVLCRGCHKIFHENGRLAPPPSKEAV